MTGIAQKVMARRLKKPKCQNKEEMGPSGVCVFHPLAQNEKPIGKPLKRKSTCVNE